MKKENRKLAQQRRARERKKKAVKKKIKKILLIVIPVLVAMICAAALIIYWQSSAEKKNESKVSSKQTEETASPDNSTEPDYSTDASLTVKDGDTVNIDYVGTVDGTEFNGGNTNGIGTDLVIGSGSYIDGFEDQLIGAHPGDTVDVTVTFPDDYGVDELNGKEAVFTVTVNGIYKS